MKKFQQTLDESKALEKHLVGKSVDTKNKPVGSPMELEEEDFNRNISVDIRGKLLISSNFIGVEMRKLSSSDEKGK